MRRLLPVLLVVPALVCACDAGGDGDDDDGSPTPQGVLLVEPTQTISGATVIERGECVGFRIDTQDFPVASPRVIFGPYELAPSFYAVLDADTLQVGFPCFYTGLDLPLGPLDVSLLEDEREVVADGAFQVVETTRLAIGEAPASSAGLANPDANGLSVAGDFDVYEWSTAANGLYLVEAVLSSAADPSFLPYLYTTRATLNPWWNGSELVLVPTVAGPHLTEVADDRVQGGAGYAYALEVSPLGTPVALAADDTCDAGAPFTSAGLYEVDLSNAAADLDPVGIETCLDRHVALPVTAGDGVIAPGPERAIRLVVGSGQTLAVAARAPFTDTVLYLLPDDGTACDPAPSSCLAASDVFGAGDTDTLLWTNEGPDRDVWLIIDEFGGGDSDPGVVTVLVRLP